MDALGDDAGCPELGLPALGSFLWSPEAVPDLDRLPARQRATCSTPSARWRSSVDGRGRGGRSTTATSAPRSWAASTSRCSSCTPSSNADAGTFALATARQRAQDDRQLLHADEPDHLPARLGPRPGARRGGRASPTPRRRSSTLKVCDPACGCGHFLIAAAHRIAKRLAAVRTGDEEPAPDAVRHGPARRDRPLHLRRRRQPDGGRAVQGQPLDGGAGAGQAAVVPRPPHPVRQQPARRDAGAAGRGHPRRGVRADRGRRQGRLPRAPQAEQGRAARARGPCSTAARRRPGNAWATSPPRAREARRASPTTRIEGVHAKEQRYAELVRSTAYESATALGRRLVRGVRLARRRRRPPARVAITERRFRAIERNPHEVAPRCSDEIAPLAEQYRFLHWHLAFPDVFQARDRIADDDVLAGAAASTSCSATRRGSGSSSRSRSCSPSAGPRSPRPRTPPPAQAMIAGSSTDDPALLRGVPRRPPRGRGREPLRPRLAAATRCADAATSTPTRSSPRLNRSSSSPTGRVGCIVPTGHRDRRHDEVLLPGPDRVAVAGQPLRLRERGVRLPGRPPLRSSSAC